MSLLRALRIAAGATVAVSLFGCHRNSKSPHTRATERPRAIGGLRVQTAAEFKQATALYQTGDKAGALSLIDTLYRDPRYSDSDRIYLQRQKAILLGRPTDSSNVSPSSAPVPLIPTGS